MTARRKRDWIPTRLESLLDLGYTLLSIRGEEILREIFVRFSDPPITYRQSRIIGVYEEHVFVPRKNGESNEEMAERTKGRIWAWCPKGAWIVPEKPHIKILFRSVSGGKYSLLLPQPAVRWHLMNAIKEFISIVDDAGYQMTPPYCPMCGAEMEKEGDVWRCPQHGVKVYESDLERRCRGWKK